MSRRIEVTLKSGRRILQRDIIEEHLVDAHITVLSYQYSAGYGIAGWYDMKGRPIQRPRAHLRVLDEAPAS